MSDPTTASAETLDGLLAYLRRGVENCATWAERFPADNEQRARLAAKLNAWIAEVARLRAENVRLEAAVGVENTIALLDRMQPAAPVAAAAIPCAEAASVTWLKPCRGCSALVEHSRVPVFNGGKNEYRFIPLADHDSQCRP